MTGRFASKIGRGVRMSLAVGVALFLVGCIGDDGDDGAPGAAGPPGPPGPTVPVPGTAIIADAEYLNVAVDAVTFDAQARVVLEFSLSNEAAQQLDGLPPGTIRFVLAQLEPGRDGASSQWQSYITGSDAGVPDVQASAELATAGTFEALGEGRYRYTFAQPLDAYPNGPQFDTQKTQRIGLEIRTTSDGFLAVNLPANNVPTDFTFSGAAATFSRDIASNATCNACHDGLAVHGNARFDIAYCVQCHNPSSIDADTGNSVDMTLMTHKIHNGAALQNGYQIVGYGGFVHDYSEVIFAQDVRNCLTCHREDDSSLPEAGNWRTVANRNACGSCHDDIDWTSTTAGHPGGLSFSDDSLCLDCHGPQATINAGLARTAVAHAIPGELASESFEFNVLDVSATAPGEFPNVRFAVTDPGANDAPYDLLGDPAFTACNDGSSRLSVILAWVAADFTNRDSGSSLSQPVTINPLGAPGCGGAASDNGDGSYTVTSPIAMPAGVQGTLLAGLEGHPWVDLNEDGMTSRDERIAVTNGFAYQGIDGASAEPRREIVSLGKCNVCHNQLSLHGNNRTDSLEVCASCHNANATDANRRSGACVDAFGDDDVAIDLKTMVHALHASGDVGVPYDVCGFGNRPVSIDFRYPGKLNQCEGCHEADTYYPVDPALVTATTVDAGDDLVAVTDDTVISPNTAVCSSCHVGDLARAHMLQNGGDIEATKAADSTLISSGIETCALCHGPGRVSDVKTVHGIEFDRGQ